MKLAVYSSGTIKGVSSRLRFPTPASSKAGRRHEKKGGGADARHTFRTASSGKAIQRTALMIASVRR